MKDNKKTFYITTPLYYPSANLHIGHCYTTILADIFTRYKKEQGYDTFFLVGSDEHGQKIEQKSKEQNKDPLIFVNEIVDNFKKLWKALDISYDVFQRTTNKQHEKLCKKIFSKLLIEKNIFKSNYSGLYCKSCEEFLTEIQMTNMECNVCFNKVSLFNEETYFLKVSQFSKYILKILEREFLFPVERRKEMINNFIKPGLFDLSVTRVSFKWGIQIKEDKDHILYVWMDALLGYLSGIKYLEDKKFFEKFWSKDTEIVQFIGKEITRFHSIYWPSILLSLNLRIPDKLISHGWIVMNEKKMSKSIGNIVDPFSLIKKYNSDVLRYFFSTAFKIQNDNNFNMELFKEHYNSNLVNNYGNLVSRVAQMIIKYFKGVIPNIKLNKNSILVILVKQTVVNFQNSMNEYDAYNANKLVMNLFSVANKQIEQKKPWLLNNKEGKEKLKNILIDLYYVIISGTYFLKPFLVNKYKEVFSQFNIKETDVNFHSIYNFKFSENINVSKVNILFKRKE